MGSSTNDDPMVAALLRERESYVRFGKKDRVAAVDEQLRLRGYEEEPARETPRARSTARGVQQAD